MLSTYPPTECGIATFAQSLTKSLEHNGANLNIFRLMNGDQSQSPKQVICEHYGKRDCDQTVEGLNQHDLAIIQHEFGIFDGRDGDEIVSILENIEVPVITVLHTVLSNPTVNQRDIINEIARHSKALVTMTQSGKAKLVANYKVDATKVHVVPHGARPVNQNAKPTSLLPEKTRPRVLTWGLIGPGKGIEWAIAAMHQLKGSEIFPEYVVAGQTHPQVKLRQGESYRNELKRVIHEFGLDEDIHFIDKYLNENELDELIASADLVVLPYDSQEQVTSGVLVEALMAGKPIVATNFPHAREVLFDKSGILVNQKDPHGIAEGIRTIIGSKHRANAMKARMNRKTSSLLWTSIGQRYLEIAHSIHGEKVSDSRQHVAS